MLQCSLYIRNIGVNACLQTQSPHSRPEYNILSCTPKLTLAT